MFRVVRHHLAILRNMLEADLKIIRRDIPHKALDTVIWALVTSIVSCFLLKLPIDSVKEIVAGGIGSVMFMPVGSQAVAFVADIKGIRHIDFLLTTPVPAWVVLTRFILNFFMGQLLITLFAFPMVKLAVGDLLPLDQTSWPLFIAIVIISNLVFATSSLLISTFVYWGNYYRIWMRIMFPMWFFGCFQFSWQTLYAKSPALAYLNLLNPFTYIMEGVRAALLGQAGYLPIWICLSGLTVLGCFMAFFAFRRLRTILDFV